MGTTKKNILLVDDEAIIALTTERVLMKTNEYEVISVNNGEKAIEIYNKHQENIDLILMDINLGEGMDGAQAASEILKNNDIPIIFLSSHTEKEIVDKTEKITSYGYVVKNSGDFVLLASIKMAFKLYEANKNIILKNMEIEEANEELQSLVEDLEETNQELILSEELLKQSEAQYRVLADNTSDMVWLMNLDFKIRYISPSVVRIRGFSLEEINSMPLESQMPPDSYKRAMELLTEMLSKNNLEKPDPYANYKIDLEFYCKDGSTFWSEIAFTLILDNNGKPVNILHSGREITDRKNAELEQEKVLQKLDGINLLHRSLFEESLLDQKLNNITDSIVKLFDADFCRIWLIQPGDLCDKGCIHAQVKEGQHVCRYRDRCLHLKSSSGRYTHIDGEVHRRVPFGCYKIGRVASEEDRKFITNDVVNEPRVHNHEWAKKLGLVSFAGYQIRVSGEHTIGVLALFAKHQISSTEDSMLDGLGSTIALIVRQAEGVDLLRESEKRYRTLFETMKDAIYIHTIDGKLIDYNPALLDLFGYTKDEIMMVNVQDVFVDPSDPEKILSIINKEGYLKDFETRHYKKDGSIMYCTISANVILSDNRNKSVIRGIIRDITERKHAEQILEKAYAKIEDLYENAPCGYHSLDSDGVFIKINNTELAWLGYSSDEIIGKKMFPDLVTDPSAVAFNNAFRLLKEKGEINNSEFDMIRKDGSIMPIALNSTAIKDINGNFVMCRTTVFDITERKEYINKLKSSYTDNVNLLNSITSILIGVSTLDIITHWNMNAEETFGFSASEVLGRKINTININWDWDQIYVGIYDSISNDCPTNLSDVNYIDKLGKKGLLGITITPIKDENGILKGFLIYGQEITEKRMIEQQLLQSSKLATIGEMATGVAHELNQPLNIIMIASQYIQDSIKKNYLTEEFLTERTEKIIKQVERAVHIIDHLRLFGRKGDYDMKQSDPNLPIRMAFDMLKEQLKIHSINVSLDLGDLPPILSDTQKLEQVFINLIINARDALEAMGGMVHEKLIKVKSSYNEKRNVVSVEFSDNGPGIPPEVRERIFEPFYTTKEVGKGTGLGLSISYGIIESHGGTIKYKQGNEGATFIILLPGIKK